MEELSGCVEDWESRIIRVVSSAAKRTFTSSEDMALETQAKVFLRWLGFSPVDVLYKKKKGLSELYGRASIFSAGRMPNLQF